MNGSADRMSPPDSSPHTHGKLACQQCQKKKIKCDRTYPCGQCTKSHLTCIPSSRKQRASRHAGKRAVDGELRNRIAKLESLVESLSGEADHNDKEHHDEDLDLPKPPRKNSINAGSPSMGKYVASSFWTSLTSEVTALRDTLESSDNEDYESPETGDSNPPDTVPDYSSLEHDFIICPPGKVFILPNSLANPNADTKKRLADTFFDNVEPLLKLFHKPTLRALLEEDAPYLGLSAAAPPNEALKRLVWFAALNTLPAAEILSLTGKEKPDALNIYRRTAGIALTKADLINTNDLATLQVFTMFVLVCRTVDASRRTWTIMALVVRIAYALNLHQEDPRSTPFMKEIRRRLWHNIRFLDKFCAIDRGTCPLIAPNQYTTPYPTNTDDNLMLPSSTSIPVLENRISDMSFSLMSFEACDAVEQLNLPEWEPSGTTWEKRLQLALDFGKTIEEKYLRHCDMNNTYHRFRHAVGNSMRTAMVVRAVRPMQRYVSSVPPPVDSPYVLEVAVDNLRASYAVYVDPEFARWRWQTWVPWHTLAVALAGLCTIRGTDLARTAWFYVEQVYPLVPQMVADSKEGMLWRPIMKLYKKATSFRDADPALMSESCKTDASRPSNLPSQSRASAKDTTTSSTWAPSFPSTTFTNPSNQPFSNVDNLSTNFSYMDPFAFPATTQSSNQPDTAQISLADSDITSLNLAPADLSGTDSGWIDWGHIMDEFADPMSVGGAGMDVDYSTNGWGWNMSFEGPGANNII